MSLHPQSIEEKVKDDMRTTRRTKRGGQQGQQGGLNEKDMTITKLSSVSHFWNHKHKSILMMIMKRRSTRMKRRRMTRTTIRRTRRTTRRRSMTTCKLSSLTFSKS